MQLKSTTPLTYTGYNAGGPYITTTSTNNSTDPHKKFSQVISTSSTTTIYMSFLVKVSTAPSSFSGPDYDIALYDTLSTYNTVRPLRFYIEQDPNNSARVRFGITTSNSSTVAYTPSSFSTPSIYTLNTTYLIVIRYDVIAGSNNDVAYLWVDPSLPGEPSTASANATKTAITETNFGSQLTAMQVEQSNSSADASFDAFLVAGNASSSVAWALITAGASSLPVTLTGFNASQDAMNDTRLTWNVADENGIQSYVVEKSSDGKNYTDIGTVTASNQSSYSFTDVQANSSNTYYRLKMVEQDGSFKLSYILTLKSQLSASLSLSPNPVRNTLIIQHPKVTGEAHLQVINTSGQLVRDFRLPASAVISNVDMSGLANGMYHVVFRSGSDVITKMVLKQ